MRKFGIISSRVWRSEKFRSLTSETARICYLYLHTCSHGNSTGCFHVSQTMIASEAMIEASGVEAALLECENVGLIRYDETEDLVQICNFFRHNTPASRKQLAGPIAMLENLPAGRLLDACKAELAIALHGRASAWERNVEARPVFMDTASRLMKSGGKRAVESGEIDLEIDHAIDLSEALLIDLAIVKETITDHDHGTITTDDHGTITVRSPDTETGAERPSPPSLPANSGQSGSPEDTIADLNRRAGRGKR